MTPLNLQEFAEELRRKGDWREAEFGSEILALLDMEEEVAEPYGTLCDDLEHYAPALKDEPAKALEWLGDRSNLLAEIEEEFANAKRPGDIDDAVKEVLGTLEQAENILSANGWTEGDFLDGLQKLAGKAPATENLTYDL